MPGGAAYLVFWILWMVAKSISQHFGCMVETIVGWYLEGARRFMAFRCRKSSIHSRGMRKGMSPTIQLVVPFNPRGSFPKPGRNGSFPGAEKKITRSSRLGLAKWFHCPRGVEKLWRPERIPFTWIGYRFLNPQATQKQGKSPQH